MARAGEHTGLTQKKFSKRIPPAARRSMFGVFSLGVPAHPRAHGPWPSDMIMSRFGRFIASGISAGFRAHPVRFSSPVDRLRFDYPWRLGVESDHQGPPCGRPLMVILSSPGGIEPPLPG